MIPINCIFFTSSINCLKRNCISKISTVSPQLINYISKSILYLLRVNIASPGNYLEFIPSPLKIYICELVVFDNKFDMNYNYQAKFGVAITKMSKMREIFLIILEKFFSSNWRCNSLYLSWRYTLRQNVNFKKISLGQNKRSEEFILANKQGYA